MSAILTGSRLPSGSFTPSDGVWTEVENDSESCASALDKNGDLILGIHKING